MSNRLHYTRRFNSFQWLALSSPSLLLLRSSSAPPVEPGVYFDHQKYARWMHKGTHLAVISYFCVFFFAIISVTITAAIQPTAMPVSAPVKSSRTSATMLPRPLKD